MKVIIVGGVAGGASCAARLRRLEEKADILMVERGPYVSYANCGLPYHVGGSIEKESSLLVATEQTFRRNFAIDCRTRCEVVGISAAEKTVQLKNHATNEVTTETYDKLVLSPGSAPIRPPLPGIDLPGIFSVRTVPDARNIREWLDREEKADRSGLDNYTGFQTVTKPRRAVVVGGGFIGLEMVENFVHRGLDVTLIEKLDQVMPPLDPEMAQLVQRYMIKHGVRLELNDGVAGFQQATDGSLKVLTSSGKSHPADVVILAIGVRPETELAKMAGIEIGQRGGIRVDDQMRTSHPDIFAVGDAVEVRDIVTGQWTLIPLAGPANRQGRIAADVIAGRGSRYRGTQGTSICQIFEGVIAQTGTSEKVLVRLGDNDFEKIYLYPNSHAGYYPGTRCLPSKSSSGNPTAACSVLKCSAKTVYPSGSIRLRWRFRWVVRFTIWKSRSFAMRRPLAAPRIRSTSRGWSRRTSSAATCRFATGTLSTPGSSLMCAILRNSPWNRYRARSISRCRNSARAWTNSPATARFSSFADRASAPTTQRVFSCRTDSKPATSPAACCHDRTRRRRRVKEPSDFRRESVYPETRADWRAPTHRRRSQEASALWRQNQETRENGLRRRAAAQRFERRYAHATRRARMTGR